MGLVPLGEADYRPWLARARARMVAARLTDRPDAEAIVDGIVARLLPDGLASPDQHVLVGADGVEGEVWFDTGVDPVVLDLHGDARALLSLVHDTAEAAGAAQMKIVVFPTQPELAAATAELGYAPIATRMKLDLPDLPDLPDRPDRLTTARTVALEPMTHAGAADFAEGLVDSYAADLLASGASPSPEAAATTARQQTDDALAQPGSVVLSAVTGGAQVGAVWLDVGADETFVLDIVVSPQHRGRGHGRALMLATEDFARARGCRCVALSVFGDNRIARGLYDALGYQVTESFLGIDL